MTGLESTLRGIVRAAAPSVIAAQGELLTERAGVINLSLETIAVGRPRTWSCARRAAWQAVLAAMAVGAVVALIVVFSASPSSSTRWRSASC